MTFGKSIVKIPPSFVKSGLARGKTFCWSVKAVGNGTSILSSAWPADRKFTTIK